MKVKAAVKPILLVILSLLIFSGIALADQNCSLIGELSEVDVFHPPADSSLVPLYNEWHYFNVIDEEQNLSMICNFKLNGAFNASEVLLGYYIDNNADAFFGMYPLNMAEYSSQTPDVRIANCTVTLTPRGYCVHIESDDGSRVFDALFKPEADPAPLFGSYGFSPLYGGAINWLVASPKMKVDGKLSVGEDEYLLKNVRGYHDHNWGYWYWGDDTGWDWGQVSQTKSSLNGNDVGEYSLSFGNITDADHTKSTNSVLSVWKNREMIAGFTSDEIEIDHPAPYIIDQAIPLPPEYKYIIPAGSFPLPMKTNISASSGSDCLDITFDLKHSVPLPVTVPVIDGSGNPVTDADGNVMVEYRIIWEMIGTYQVEGVIDGKPISYAADGFMEYVSGEPVSPVPLS
jgi:hypothetical protein